MADTTLGCAQNADGTLRPASEIVFYNDVDDTVPIAGPSTTPSPPIHPLFSGVRPLDRVAGVRRSSPRRRSGRTLRPSARVADPNNAETTVGAGKRKAESVVSHPAPKKRLVVAADSSDVESDAESSDEHMEAVETEAEDVAGEAEHEVIDVEQYESFKAMGDADHEHAITKTPRIDATADIRTVFQRVKDNKNARTGKLEDGAICLVCTRKGMQAAACFLTGSVSTLRSHIARHEDHFKVYKARCEELKIEMHERAIPKDSSSLSRQGTLDGIVVAQPRPPAFTVDGLRDYLIEMIVTQDEAFSIVERPSFIRLLKYLRPSLKDSDIPTRNTIRSHILSLAADVQNTLRIAFKATSGLHSLTHDAWTSIAGKPFININDHYVSSPPDRPNDWELVTNELAFVEIEGRHTGANLGAAILKTIDKYELRGKVGWITADGASVNRTTAKTVEHGLDARDRGWTAKEGDMMCIEHAVHIATKHVVETIAPTPQKPLHTKIRQLLSDARSKGDLSEDELATVISALGGGGANEPEENETECDWTMGDVLGKMLALIKQIRMSPQARTFFKKCCVQAEVPKLELLLWVRTRWASLYKSLDRFLALRKAVDLFVCLADDSDEVPDLRKKEYREYTLTKREWEKLQRIHEGLREPADVTQSFSSERTPTVWRIIPTLEFLIQRWETMAAHPNYVEIKAALLAGVQSLKKWFHRADTTSSAYFICLVLDPTIKDVYFRTRWGDEEYKKGMASLETVFDRYYAAAQAEAQVESAPAAPAAVVAPALHRYGSSFLLDAVASVKAAERAQAQPRDELSGYLSSPLEQTDNVLHYWGHNTSFPILRRMARDYLAIQGSATPAERAFSSGALTGTKLRNSLSTEMFEALQLLKSAYRNGHISAGSIAARHIDALIAELDADFGYAAEDEDEDS